MYIFLLHACFRELCFVAQHIQESLPPALVKIRDSGIPPELQQMHSESLPIQHSAISPLPHRVFFLHKLVE